MFPEHAQPWQENGARAATRAERPDRFIDQHVSPLFFRRTDAGPPVRGGKDIVSEEQFWGEGAQRGQASFFDYSGGKSGRESLFRTPANVDFSGKMPLGCS